MINTADLGLSQRQDESLGASDARVNIWHGAIRSGKTFASLLRWLCYVANAPRGGELVVVGRTRESISRNVFGPLQDPSLFGPFAGRVHYTAGSPSATILGRKVHVIGASDAKAEKVLRGLTCAGAYVDEVTVVSNEFFVQLLGRMSIEGAQLFGTTNPDTPTHWLKENHLDRLHQLPDWRAWRFRLDDNPSLAESIKDAYRRDFTGLWRRRFVEGEWVAAEGAIYDMWDPERHVVAWSDLPHMRRLLAVGVDYGTTVATSVILLGLGVDDRLYLVDEWRHDPKHAERLTDGQLSEGMRDWIARPHLPDGSALRPEYVVVDPSAASLRVQLYRDGLATTPANNQVAHGIGMVATLLAQGQLLVSDRCTGFIREAPGYSWDDKATEKGEDKPLKVADHSCDSARYAVATSEPLWRPHLAPAA